MQQKIVQLIQTSCKYFSIKQSPFMLIITTDIRIVQQKQEIITDMAQHSPRRPNNQQQPTISLYSDQSLIEEYHELEFSDQKSRDNLSSSSDNACKELSGEMLKYLGVDKFPINNIQKMEPETQEQTYWMQQVFHQKVSPPKKQEPEKFNIDSFLNTHSYHRRVRKNSEKQGINTTVNQDRPHKKRNRSHQSYHAQKFPYKKSGFSIISQKSELGSQASLVTLPEPPSPKSSYFQPPQLRDNLFTHRFQQAKLKFIDCFLPDSHKIQNNPYAFYKYSQRKSYNLIR